MPGAALLSVSDLEMEYRDMNPILGRYLLRMIVCLLLISCLVGMSSIRATSLIDLDDLEIITLSNAHEIKNLMTIGEKGGIPIRSFAFSPTDSTIAYAVLSPKLSLWNFTTLEESIEFDIGDLFVRDVTFSLDGKYLITIMNDDSIRIWDLSNQESEMFAAIGEFGWSENIVSVHPKGELAAYAADNVIHIFNLQTKHEQASITATDDITAFAFDRSGDLLVYADGYGDSLGIPIITVFSLTTNESIHKMEGHEWSVSDLVISSDGEFLVSCSDRTISIWNMATGERLVQRNTRYSHLNTLALNHDDTLLVTGSNYGSVMFWDMSDLSDESIRPLLYHTDPITRIRFDSTGKLLASSSDDGTLRLWGVSRRE